MKKSKNSKTSSWYSFKIDKDRLLEFSKTTIGQRLEWLEEANKFLNSIADNKTKKRWQLFRESKI